MPGEEQVTMPYHLDGIDFGPNFGPVSIRYNRPEDITPSSQEFRQLSITDPTEEQAEIIADVMDSLCQLVELEHVRRRNPSPTVRARGG